MCPVDLKHPCKTFITRMTKMTMQLGELVSHFPWESNGWTYESNISIPRPYPTEITLTLILFFLKPFELLPNGMFSKIFGVTDDLISGCLSFSNTREVAIARAIERLVSIPAHTTHMVLRT